MDDVARGSSSDRRELFEETAKRKGLVTSLVEKDFWVCWTLRQLFLHPDIRSHLLFKGGTTLSKVFGLIDRFSEDIDLVLDWELLGFSGEKDPKAQSSKKQQTKLLKGMRSACNRFIAGPLLGTLQQHFEASLTQSQSWNLELDPQGEDTINFFYPRATDSTDYVRQVVCLELGIRGEFEPSDWFRIHPYVADYFPESFTEADCQVRATEAIRTFWEKATILHQEHFRDEAQKPPHRYARHFYDLYQMAASDRLRESALADAGLLARVVQHKRTFFRCAWARYEQANPAGLQLLPSDFWAEYLRQDYEAMGDMLFGEPPAFDEILDGLARLESDIRQM